MMELRNKSSIVLITRRGNTSNLRSATGVECQIILPCTFAKMFRPVTKEARSKGGASQEAKSEGAALKEQDVCCRDGQTSDDGSQDCG